MNNPTQRGIIKTYYDEVIEDKTKKITGYNFVPFYDDTIGQIHLLKDT